MNGLLWTVSSIKILENLLTDFTKTIATKAFDNLFYLYSFMIYDSSNPVGPNPSDTFTAS